MIELVVDNLNIDARHIFIAQREHYEKYNLKQLLNLIAPGCEIVLVDGLTDGAARTVLLAKEFINNDDPLFIANSDQYVPDFDSNAFMYSMKTPDIAAQIATFQATHPKWSYVSLNEAGFIDHIVEKQVISNIATVGFYAWNKGRDCVRSIEQMIAKDVRTNNEFYLAPSLNELIQEGALVKNFPVRDNYSLGTPEDLQTTLAKFRG